MNKKIELAKYIDHTLLKADATKEALQRLCEEALQHQFAGVCVNSCHVEEIASHLKNSEVKTVAVVGFPLGAMSTAAKVCETQEAIRDGAQEIDMVINIGALKDRDYRKVYEDIRGVVDAAQGNWVKVIIETAYLTEHEKVIACVLAKTAGAKFVKTSTGFADKGATEEDVRLMKMIVGEDMSVKASGGIRTKADLLKMVEAGADRVGASASVKIVLGD